MSDAFWNGAFGLALAIIGVFMELQRRKLAKVEKTGDQTHALVNSASLVQLRLYAVAARRIAELTGDNDDIEAAKLATTLAREHELKQKQALDGKR
jgi:hypothetical protein